jgi:hypothetical protein
LSNFPIFANSDDKIEKTRNKNASQIRPPISNSDLTVAKTSQENLRTVRKDEIINTEKPTVNLTVSNSETTIPKINSAEFLLQKRPQRQESNELLKARRGT